MDAHAFPVPWSVLDAVPTPALVVDLAAVDANIDAMERLLSTTSITLRPHFKAHKCTRLMRRQLAARTVRGVTCATAHEAIVLGDAGFDDILIANELIEPVDLEAVAALAGRATVTVVVDDLEQVARLAAATARYDATLGVLIDVDPGLGRTGVTFDSPDVVTLAQAIGAAPGLRFRGIQAYEGHVMLQRDADVRRTLTWQVAAMLERVRSDLRTAGFDCEVISGGGTGTVMAAAELGAFTEVQAGSYVLMDTTYGEIGTGFRQALFAIGTVMSRRTDRTATLNAGTKSVSVDKGLPRVLHPGARLIGMGDEHGRMQMEPGIDVAVGDRIALVPSHVDPTVNLHGSLHVVDGDHVEVWTIDGRRP